MGSVSIPLGSRKYPGLFALIDEEDYKRVSQHRWHPVWAKGRWYVKTALPTVGGKQPHVYLHHFILGIPNSLLIDHVNGNGLDNRRCNVRLATNQLNQANQGPQKRNRCGYKGVYRPKDYKAWLAQIYLNGKRIVIGSFKTPEEAARAYDAKALEFWGEYARLNFPGEQLSFRLVGSPPIS